MVVFTELRYPNNTNVIDTEQVCDWFFSPFFLLQFPMLRFIFYEIHNGKSAIPWIWPKIHTFGPIIKLYTQLHTHIR